MPPSRLLVIANATPSTTHEIRNLTSINTTLLRRRRACSSMRADPTYTIRAVSGSRVLSLLSLLVALAAVPVAGGANGDETRLAKRFAPVVRLVAQDEECG